MLRNRDKSASRAASKGRTAGSGTGEDGGAHKLPRGSPARIFRNAWAGQGARPMRTLRHPEVTGTARQVPTVFFTFDISGDGRL
jgi:hypothetical protein